MSQKNDLLTWNHRKTSAPLKGWPNETRVRVTSASLGTRKGCRTSNIQGDRSPKRRGSRDVIEVKTEISSGLLPMLATDVRNEERSIYNLLAVMFKISHLRFAKVDTIL